jgi:hypothetical protein
MANTFKLKTKDGSSTGANTDMTVYTVPSATTTVIIGCTIANITASAITVDATLENNDGDNIKIGLNLPIPTGSSLDILAGKIVMEASDVLKIQSDTANSTSIALSIMEQT